MSTQVRLPDENEAHAFALMLSSGLPASDAILYFTESQDPSEIAAILDRWTRCRIVKQAHLKLMGKPWQDMDLEERMKYALDQHYAQLSYYLYSHNYSELGSADKQKADTARAALEAKIAGTAGKQDYLTRFFDDLTAGKLAAKMMAPTRKSSVN